MSQEYDWVKLFGTEQFHDFGEIGRGLQVVYPVSTNKFPIGYINDPNGKSANESRQVVDTALGEAYGPILHLALAPHKEHNIVGTFREGLLASTTFVGDGLMVRRTGKPFVANTFLGDCACVVVWDDDWVGYMHIGWPELTQTPDNIVDRFEKLWPGGKHTSAWMGPAIGAKFFERTVVPAEPSFLQRYVGKTHWGTQGFDLANAIDDRLRNLIGAQGLLTREGIDPYYEREDGNYVFASDQWAKRKSAELGFQVCNPRNAAMLFVAG